MIQDRLIKENGCVAVCDNTAISNDEWLEIRKGYINGTDAGKIAGVCHWGNKLSVYLDKTLPAIPKEDPANRFKFQCGHSMEPVIADWYRNATGYKVENVTLMLRHPTIPFIAGDMDYIAESPSGEMIGLEIKTTDEINIYDNFRAGILGVEGRLPGQYEYQVRHYMAVTGINRFIVLVCYGFDSTKVIPVTVYRDLELEEQIIGMEIDFWNNNIVPQVQPEGGLMKKEDLKAIQKAVFAHEGEIKELPDEAEGFLTAYQELSAEKKKAEAGVKEIEEKLNAVIAEICRMSSGVPLAVRKIDEESYYEVVNKVSSRTTVDSEKIKLNYPDIFQECRKITEFEQTTIKIRKNRKTKGA